MNRNLKIKVCGMRDADNIRAVAALGIDFLGFIFYPKSPRYTRKAIPETELIADTATTARHDDIECRKPQRVGVFVDEMPQTIITHIYNDQLDYVQLHGHELPEMIDNLKRTVIPDIRHSLKVIKAFSIAKPDDLLQTKAYEGVADLFLFDTPTESYGGSGKKFDWQMLQAYDGHTPFLLSGGIGPEDIDRIHKFEHPQCIGIDLNSRFETAPGIKDVEALRRFTENLRA